MDLSQFRYFIAAAESGSLNRAAQQLGRTQTIVLRQIRQLEVEIGAALFHRSARGVQLTPAGTSFLSAARAVVAQIDSAVDDARWLADGANALRITHVPLGPCEAPLHNVLATFRQRYPRARVATEPRSHAALAAELDAGRVDLAVACAPPAAGAPLARAPMFDVVISGVLVADDHPIAAMRRPLLRDLAPWPCVIPRRALDPGFVAVATRAIKDRLGSGDPVTDTLAESIEQIPAAIVACNGFGLASRQVAAGAPQGMTFVAFADEPIPVTFSLFWRADAPPALLDALVLVVDLLRH